jgi:hypothetical protein
LLAPFLIKKIKEGIDKLLRNHLEEILPGTVRFLWRM